MSGLLSPPERFASKFNEAMSELEASYRFAQSQDISQHQEKLSNASASIYDALELCVGRVASSLIKDGSLTASDEKILKENRAVDYFKKSLEVIVRHRNINSQKIDVQLIKDSKVPLRNQVRHNGVIPFYSLVIKVSQEIGKLLIELYPNSHVKSVPLPETFDSDFIERADYDWEKLYLTCYGFEDDRTYILIVKDLNKLSMEDRALLARLNWSLIIDLDPSTDEDGFYFSVDTVFKTSASCPSIRLITYSERKALAFSEELMYWFAITGLKNLNQASHDYREWRQTKKEFARRFLQEFARTFSSPATTVILDDSKYINDICEIIDSAYKGSNNFVYAVSDVDKLASTIEDYPGDEISIPIDAIVDGIRRFSSSLQVQQDLPTETIVLPAKDNTEIELTIEDYKVIEESFEIVHKNVHRFPKAETQEKEEFRKGQEITWHGLSHRFDIDRDCMERISRKLEAHFRLRENSVLHLFYAPGMGGTTIAKRVAWGFREKYPTLMLKRFEPTETASRAQKVNLITKKPVFIIIDSASISTEDVNKLLSEIRIRTFPTVMLVVNRNNSPDEIRQTPSNSEKLLPVLSDDELERFIVSYKELCPNRRNELTAILNSSMKQSKNPFYIGLTAFERDFSGLRNLVQQCLTDATTVQKQIALYLAIADLYAHRGLHSRFFAKTLRTPDSGTVYLEDYLSENLKRLIVSNAPDKRGGKKNWKPLHYLISEELRNQILVGDSGDVNTVYQLIPDRLVQMIDDSVVGSDSKDTIELLEDVFIRREKEYILDASLDDQSGVALDQGRPATNPEQSYSVLMEEIGRDNRLLIFLKLVECYPEHPHFRAHLARFYSREEDQLEKALENINQAIEQLPEDFGLHHIKGMCLARRVGNIIKPYLHRRQDCPQSVSDDIVDKMKEIELIFQKVRELKKQSDYGYVSHINLIVDVIRFGFDTSRSQSMEEFLTGGNRYWYREQLDLADGLFEDLKSLMMRNTENSGRAIIHFTSCEDKLKTLRGKHDYVIRNWERLVNKRDVYQPIVRRQLVRAYHRQAESWQNMKIAQRERVLKYLESNIAEPQNKPAIARDINLWFQAARYSNKIDLDAALAKVSRWSALTESSDALFYLYVLTMLKVLEGSDGLVSTARNLINECVSKNLVRDRRTMPVEWYGRESDLRRLISLDSMGKKRADTQCWENTNLLEPLIGFTNDTLIKGGRGHIQMRCGLQAFFVPPHANRGREGGYLDGSIQGIKKVKFFLAFSYDGLRAYDVRDDDASESS